jgi:tyrosine-protein kinase Etk/Wzc
MASSQVQEANEVRGATRGAFLGYLMLQRNTEMAELEASPALSEAIRMVRTALLYRLEADAGGHVVQLTSAGPGSGKTTTAILLARSLAQCGKHVLLVDTDIPRPALAERLLLSAAPGLLELLDGRETEDRAIRPTTVPGLHVLPTGRASHAHQVEALANGAFSALINKWCHEYDVVLLDSPPLLASADAAILARHAAGTVMVVRERHCERQALVEALARLSAAGGTLLGTVFVGSSQPALYGYGYGYGHAETENTMDAAAHTAAERDPD